MPSGVETEIIFWLVIAVLSFIGELLTGSFFLLPFVMGAAAAALTAALGAELPWVLGVFLFVSLASLLLLHRFARRSDAAAPGIQAGAHRYVDSVATVTTAIEPAAEGRVRLEGQTWRARSIDKRAIAVGTEVRVVEVRGTALVVEVRGKDPAVS